MVNPHGTISVHIAQGFTNKVPHVSVVIDTADTVTKAEAPCIKALDWFATQIGVAAPDGLVFRAEDMLPQIVIAYLVQEFGDSDGQLVNAMVGPIPVAMHDGEATALVKTSEPVDVSGVGYWMFSGEDLDAYLIEQRARVAALSATLN